MVWADVHFQACVAVVALTGPRPAGSGWPGRALALEAVAAARIVRGAAALPVNPAETPPPTTLPSVHLATCPHGYDSVQTAWLVLQAVRRLAYREAMLEHALELATRLRRLDRSLAGALLAEELATIRAAFVRVAEATAAWCAAPAARPLPADDHG